MKKIPLVDTYTFKDIFFVIVLWAATFGILYFFPEFTSGSVIYNVFVPLWIISAGTLIMLPVCIFLDLKSRINEDLEQSSDTGKDIGVIAGIAVAIVLLLFLVLFLFILG